MSTNALTLTRLLLNERLSFQRLARRIVGSAAAEDVTQGLWFKVQSVKDDPPIENPRAYLCRLTVHAATDALRAARRQGGRAAAEAAEILWLEDDTPGADRVAIGREELDRVLRAVADLPEPTRSIFCLNRFEGLTQREISGRFGVSTTVVERHIRRALKTLDGARQGA